MKIIIFLSILCISTQLTHSLSISGGPAPPRKPSAYEVASEKIKALEGKSVIPIPCSTNTSSNNVDIRSGVPEELYRWRNGFFVHPDPAFTQDEMQMINSALYDLHQVLCVGVGIWPQNSRPTGDYAFIKKDFSNSGCYSNVGKQGGKQIINIGTNGCVNKQTIIHESIHALGFHHEQSRPDRDDYVKIFREHIIPGKEHNFDIAKGSLTFDVPYDYSSIMHYPSVAFSKDRVPTMLKKDGGEIGWNSEITAYDAQKLKAMYNCN